MQLAQWQVGRKKYCSNPCKYRYRVRPSGLSYDVKVVNPSWLQKGHTRNLTGPASPMWKGDEVSYVGLHVWVRKNKTRVGACEWCGKAGLTDWANLSHEYIRDLADWVELCRTCHRRHDSGPNRGAAVARYGTGVQG